MTDLRRAIDRLVKLDWSEDDAYHVLRRSACDLGMTMEEVAARFLQRGYVALSYQAVRRTNMESLHAKADS